MRSDEIERAWAIMDPIIAAVEREGGPAPETYPVGSYGPKCADELLARDGRRWQNDGVRVRPAAVAGPRYGTAG